MLKNSESTKSTIWLKESRVGVGGDGKAIHDSRCKFGGNKINHNKVDNDDIVKEKNYQKTSKFKKLSKSRKR